MIYISSDYHFNHRNSLKWRPGFSSIEELDQLIIDNINEVVQPNDTLYHLGDLSFCKYPEDLAKILRQIKCEHVKLLNGNHIRKDVERKAVSILPAGKFEDLGDYHEMWYQTHLVEEGKVFVVMCHYPMLRWNRSHYGSLNCWGHIHSKEASDKIRQPRSWNVNVEFNNYYPWSLDDIIKQVKDEKPAFVE